MERRDAPIDAGNFREYDFEGGRLLDEPGLRFQNESDGIAVQRVQDRRMYKVRKVPGNDRMAAGIAQNLEERRVRTEWGRLREYGQDLTFHGAGEGAFDEVPLEEQVHDQHREHGHDCERVERAVGTGELRLEALNGERDSP